MSKANVAPERRQVLSWARSIISAPERHPREVIDEACDVLSRFGNIDDLSDATRMRAAVATGEVKPGTWAKSLRWRAIKIAALIAVAVWVLAWGIASIGHAQETGRMPSILEMIQ